MHASSSKRRSRRPASRCGAPPKRRPGGGHRSQARGLLPLVTRARRGGPADELPPPKARGLVIGLSEE
jgi:hypothetical protein